MIENIKREFVSYGNESTYRDDKKFIFEYLCHLKRTVNELVDAVNGILYYAPLEMAQKAEPDGDDAIQEVIHKEPADPYAEQRRWIGKLCKFWDIDNDNLYYGPLTKIHDTSPYCYECNHKMCYANCEPVSEDLIYKGGDNE